MLFKGYCCIEKIIVSLSLSNLISPNSNSFPMNSNIAETKTPFLYTDEDRRKNTRKKDVFYISGNSPTFAYRRPLRLPQMESAGNPMAILLPLCLTIQCPKVKTFPTPFLFWRWPPRSQFIVLTASARSESIILSAPPTESVMLTA